MNVSVIVTVKNEGDSIRNLLKSLVAQTRPADEIVICDGGSTDQTLAILQEYQKVLPLKIVVAADANISRGRNRAIAAAAGPIIAGTDAGVVLNSQWLERLVMPIERYGAQAVCGWFESDPHNDFEVVLGATVLPDLSDIDPSSFLPSSRSVAYLKSAWEAAGGYPEWLDFGEDLVYDLALKQVAGPFSFAPGAIAYFRPRSNMRSFARQYYFYSRGDGKANLWPKRHAIRYLTYLVAFPLLLRWIWQGKWFGWFFMLIGGGVYCRRPAQRLWPDVQEWSVPSKMWAFVLIPLIRLVGDFAKMIGYPVGVWWRIRRKSIRHRGRN